LFGHQVFVTMNQLDNVVITDVTKKNFEKLWPQIIEDIANSSFVSIDAEMSGLGSPKKTMTSNLDERYAVISLLAATRSIISLGLACFKCLQEDTEKRNFGENKINYCVAVYNIMLLCSDPYTVDPKAVEFLVEHGFNFNKQFAEGISFYRGNDRPNVNVPEVNMRNLFCEIIRRRKPLVLHNGFADLIFMYQSFYAQCPSKLTTFMADLSEIYPSGIYDTKYIAEFVDHTPASFLLYIFRYNLLKNEELGHQSKIFVQISFTRKSDDSMFVSLYEQSIPDNSVTVCNKYAAYGWCINGKHCKQSHNIDAVLQFHKIKKNKSRKRKARTSTKHVLKSPCVSSDDSKDSITILNSEKFDSTIDNNVNKIELGGDGPGNKAPFINSNKISSETEQPSFLTQNDTDIETCIRGNQCDETVDATLKINSISSLQCHQDNDNADINTNLNGAIYAASKNGQNTSPNDGHRSGIDAFMTGYAFAVFIASHCRSLGMSSLKNDTFSDAILHLPTDIQKTVVNKLFLSGRNIPLPVCKSKFTKTSKCHSEKIIKVYLK